MSLLGIALLLTGCRSTATRETWEARYRDQRDEIFALNKRIEELEQELVVREQESNTLRVQATSSGQTAMLTEQANALYRVTGIRINKLLTGGLDQDGRPGDDALSLLLAPHDEDGTLVKLPGTLSIELIDHSRPADNQTIGTWQFSPAEMKAHWHSGIVGVGYLFDLEWQQFPAREELVLHARLVTADDRQYDATEKIRIQPPTSAEPVYYERTASGTSNKGSETSRYFDQPPSSRPTAGQPAMAPPVADEFEDELVPTPRDQPGVPSSFDDSIPEFDEVNTTFAPDDAPGFLRIPTLDSNTDSKFNDTVFR